jgi:hypothetical protein
MSFRYSRGGDESSMCFFFFNLPMAVFSAFFCIAIATGRTDTRNEAIIWGCTYSL